MIVTITTIDNCKLSHFDPTKTAAVKQWIIDLSTKVEPSDPHYIKEKIALLWVSIAKRVWGNHLIKSRDSHHNSVDENTTLSTNLDNNNKLSTSITEQESADGWVSMDADLLKLWNNNITCRELSLIIIRTLFEDIYLLDDPISSKEAPY